MYSYNVYNFRITAACLSMVSSQNNQEYVQQITAGSGIHFNYLGTVRAKNNRLNVIIPMEITHFNVHLDDINFVLESVRSLCKQVNVIKVGECQNILDPLTVRYRDIFKQLNSISHLLDNRVKRSAWIGGIGSIIKQIFGNLDESDGLKYNEAIETLENNEKKLASLMKDSILVTTSVITQYNKTLQQIKANEESVNEALEKLTSKFRNLTLALDDLEIQNEINFIFNSLETALLTLSFQTEDMIDAIVMSSQNIIHPSVITPSNLLNELAINYKYLPNHLQLPLDLDISTIHIIQRISNVLCYYVNNKIIFVLQIPLVSREEYKLFQVMPLPVAHNDSELNSFSLIVPNTKYVILSKDNVKYSNLPNLVKCNLLYSSNYICDVPNIYVSNTKPSCESELLTKIVTKIPKECNTKFIIGKLDSWTPLDNNKWIFVQSESVKATFDCKNKNSFEITIKGVGILTLPKDCTCYTKNTVLFSQQNEILNITSPVLFSDFSLIKDKCCNLNKLHATMEDWKIDKLRNIEIDNMDLENSKLKDIAIDIDKIQQSPHIVKYGTHYSILTFIIIIIVIGFSLYKLIKLFRKRGSNINLKILKKDKVTNNVDSNSEIELEEIPRPSVRIMK